LKISANIKDIKGPWGGGLNFFRSLQYYGLEENINVINHLNDKDIDIILLINNLKGSSSASYTVDKAFDYRDTYKNLIFQRINECDQRKGTTHVNQQIIDISTKVNGCIFVSSWLKSLFAEIKNNNQIIIKNGADSKIFTKKDFFELDKKVKLVTHHFSDNYLKGFKYYKKLDDILNDVNYSNKFEFTVIGNKPKNITFHNSKVIKPLSKKKLSEELRLHDVYITASVNEPGANHVVEGLSCGLPAFYYDSGSMSEYVSEFGIKFSEDNFIHQLDTLEKKLPELKKIILNYDYSAQKMCQNYFNFFKMNL